MSTVCPRYGRKGNSEMSKDGIKLIDKETPAPVEILPCYPTPHSRHVSLQTINNMVKIREC